MTDATLQTCYEHIGHTLSKRTDPRITTRFLANQAGHFFMDHHPWVWAQRRPGKLSFAAPITFTDGTWTEATSTLTATLTGYTYTDDDKVTITAGTSAILKEYTITSGGASSAVLSSSLSSTAGNLATGDIAGTINHDYFALPSDFQSMVGIQASDSLTREFEEVSPQQLQELRSNPIQSTSWFYYGAISHSHEPGAVVPLIELYPTPGSEELDFLTIWYRAQWAELTDDTTKLTIPEWCLNYYLQVLRAFARGYEEEDVMSLTQRLTEVAHPRNPIGMAPKRRDGSVRVSLGPTRHGALAMVAGQNTINFLRTPVQAPS